MNKSPYFNRKTRSTKHGDYLDSVALFKLGQIDLKQLETAIEVAKVNGVNFVSPKGFKEIDLQEFIPVLPKSNHTSPKQSHEISEVKFDLKYDRNDKLLSPIPIYPFTFRSGQSFKDVLLLKLDYLKMRARTEEENKKRYELRQANKKHNNVDPFIKMMSEI